MKFLRHKINIKPKPDIGISRYFNQMQADKAISTDWKSNIEWRLFIEASLDKDVIICIHKLRRKRDFTPFVEEH